MEEQKGARGTMVLESLMTLWPHASLTVPSHAKDPFLVLKELPIASKAGSGALL